MIDRLISAAIGAVAGGVVYFGFDLLSSRYGIGSGHWSLSGHARWYILAGAVLGFLGGRGLADYLWARATDGLRDDATWTIGTGLVILVAVALAVGLLFALR